ncbi:hypothetical protein Xedl_02858 [Xenorhabdus eapokensis]|uniref:Uncharacterized protein n=1 Tax=Xenorhabdus eapokensis TaxID=1873482 RepID=A0A1Q5TMZ4_9GAMM|nr:hypothetical protein Xedl_02858 [Xenorhabdus eapokensis]
MVKNIPYFQEIEFLRGLPWSSENVSRLSSQIAARISVSQDPVLAGLSCIFILIKVFRDEGHSDLLLYKYDLVALEVIEFFYSISCHKSDNKYE